MTCKHRYEPVDIGYKVEGLKNHYFWSCKRCGNVILAGLKERST